MAADTAPRRGAPKGGAPKGVGGRLTAKVGPLPVYAWALIIVGVGYLAYRHYGGGSGSGSGSSGLATSGAAGAAGSGAVGGAGDTSGAGGGSSTGTGDGFGDNGYGQITALLGQYGAQLDALGAQVGAGTPYAYDPSAAADFNSAATLQPKADGTYLDTRVVNGVTQFTPIATSAPLANTDPQHPYSTAASATNYAGSAQTATAAAKAAGKASPFGGVVSTKKLANGSTLTTYASGRQVQQVPGKSAYVVKA